MQPGVVETELVGGLETARSRPGPKAADLGRPGTGQHQPGRDRHEKRHGRDTDRTPCPRPYRHATHEWFT